MNGKFIVLEGIDGSGISTQVEVVRVWCEIEGIDVLVTKEPSDGPVGSQLKAALTHRIAYSHEVMALLFTADRLDHLEHEIVPKLDAGTNVISDRYYLSSYAYQSQSVELEWLETLNQKCRKPDTTIFLDVPIETCLERWRSDVWRSNDRLQLYEDEHLLRRVRESYLAIIDKLRGRGEELHVVDGSGTIQEVGLRVIEVLSAKFADHSPPHSGSTTSKSEINTDKESILRFLRNPSIAHGQT